MRAGAAASGAFRTKGRGRPQIRITAGDYAAQGVAAAAQDYQSSESGSPDEGDDPREVPPPPP
eukprot:5344388-Lingulodinium_polyedra.AAC.1